MSSNDAPVAAEKTQEGTSRLAEVSALLRRYRLPCTTERELQDAIERVFVDNKIPYSREHCLDPKDRGSIVDFMVWGSTAVECKVEVQPTAVFRQVERYLKFDEVKELLLVTSKHMGLPAVVQDKKTSVFKVGLTWL